MQIDNVRAYWHMVLAWLADFFANFSFVYSYKIMLSLKTV